MHRHRHRHLGMADMDMADMDMADMDTADMADIADIAGMDQIDFVLKLRRLDIAARTNGLKQ